jgi:hypothetical protein
MATLIRANGDESPIQAYTLQQLQDAVGGLVEIVTLRDGQVIVMNEAGRLERMPPNPKATKLARQEIVGPALYLSAHEWFNVNYNAQPSEHDEFEGGRCNASMWAFIEKARQAEIDADEEGHGSLHNRVLGGAMEQLKLWGEENGVPLLREEAVGVLLKLFLIRKTKVMTGGIDPQVVSDDEWENPI